MKKIILILSVLCIGFASQSQTMAKGDFTSQYGNTKDTIANTGSKTLTAFPTSGKYTYCQYTITATNISGTSNVTAILQHSTDGTNWVVYSGDTLAVAAAGTKGFRWTGYSDYKMRLIVTGTGSQSTSIKASYILR